MYKRGVGYFLWVVIISVLLIVTCQPSNAQADSSAKPPIQKVYVYEKIDTVKSLIILYGDDAGNVKYVRDGYIILKGDAVKNDKGEFQWITPTQLIIGALDNRKKPIKNFIAKID